MASNGLCAIKGCELRAKRYDLCVKHLILARDGATNGQKDPEADRVRELVAQGVLRERREAAEKAKDMTEQKQPGKPDCITVCTTPKCGQKPDGTRGQCKHCTWYRLHGADADKRAQVMSHALAPKHGAPGTASGRSVQRKPEPAKAKRPTPPAPPQETLVEQAARLQDGVQQFADLLGLQQMPVAGGHVMHNPGTRHVVYLTGDGMHRIDLPGQETAETDP